MGNFEDQRLAAIQAREVETNNLFIELENQKGQFAFYEEGLRRVRLRRLELLLELRKRDVPYRELAEGCGLTTKRVQELVANAPTAIMKLSQPVAGYEMPTTTT